LSIQGGAVRSLSVIGLVRLLQEEGWDPDVIAGSSAGGMVAVMYSLGLKWHEMVNEIKITGKKDIISIADLFKYKSLLSPGKFRELFLRFMNEDTRIEDLPKKLVLFASDPSTVKRVYIEEGNLLNAMLATSAYPIFAPSPIKIQGKVVVDGDLTASYSSEWLKENCGVEKVIGTRFTVEDSDLDENAGILDKFINWYKVLKVQAMRFSSEANPADLEIVYDVTGQSYLGMENIDKYVDIVYEQVKSEKQKIFNLIYENDE
jgi:predicted acylesterase/phospholipase RssA